MANRPSSPAMREFHAIYQELTPENRSRLMDMLCYRSARSGKYQGKPWPVVRGFVWWTIDHTPGYMLPLLMLAILVLVVGMGCTLTAPPASLVEVQNSPTPPATSPFPALLATPTTAMDAGRSTPSVTPKPTLKACEVTTQALNVRACAGLTCAPIAWLYSGDVATILPTPHTTDWLPIEGGWIYAKFCEAKP